MPLFYTHLLLVHHRHPPPHRLHHHHHPLPITIKTFRLIRIWTPCPVPFVRPLGHQSKIMTIVRYCSHLNRYHRRPAKIIRLSKYDRDRPPCWPNQSQVKPSWSNFRCLPCRRCQTRWRVPKNSVNTCPVWFTCRITIRRIHFDRNLNRTKSQAIHRALGIVHPAHPYRASETAMFLDWAPVVAPDRPVRVRSTNPAIRATEVCIKCN